MAREVIEEVGLSGDYLSAPRTVQHFRKVLSRPVLATRTRRSRWEALGARTFEEAAQQRVAAILAAEPKTHLDAHQEAELERIEASGRRALLGG